MAKNTDKCGTTENADENKKKPRITAKQNEDGTFTFFGRSFKITEDKNKALEPYGKQIANYGIVLRLLPNAEQANLIDRQIGNARFVKNNYIYYNKKVWKEEKRFLSATEYRKDFLPDLIKEKPFLEISDKRALQNKLEATEEAFKKFFDKKAGYPNFSSKYKPSGSKYQTNNINNNIDIVSVNGVPCIKLPKLGKIPFVLPKGQTIESIKGPGIHIINATISNTRTEVYEVSLCMETVIDKVTFTRFLKSKNIVGMDLGIKEFCVLCNGDEDNPLYVENPRWIQKHAKRVRRLQQSLARKQYDKDTHIGSKNREKARIRLAKEQRKLKNQRKDFHHKLARRIVDSYSAVICEDLNIKGMLKNHHLAKSISSVGWGQFVRILQYKLEKAGKYLIKVDRFFPSSQKCFVCGEKNKKVKDLKVRKWICPSCGAVHKDRDANAACNIWKEGIRIMQNADICVND